MEGSEIKFDVITQSVANSARTISEFYRRNEAALSQVAQAKQEQINREKRIAAGADASIAQKELLEHQLEIIQKQNELLSDNYLKLKEMFDVQVEANKEAKEELKRSRQFNIAMMIIAIVAMLAAIAGPIATIWVSI